MVEWGPKRLLACLGSAANSGRRPDYDSIPPCRRGMIGNRAGWAAWLLILVGRRSIRLVLGDEGVSVSTGSSIDQETDAGVRYARAMGTALLGLLGDRPAIHMRDCNTPNRIAPKSAFRARWQASANQARETWRSAPLR